MEQKRLDKLVGQATRLVDLADYQEGSVVSRTVVDKKAGTVTFFAFAEGQGLSEHTARHSSLVRHSKENTKRRENEHRRTRAKME